MERIYHPWDAWECYENGFFKKSPPEGMTKEDCLEVYRTFFRDLDRFNENIDRVFNEWPNSCEHNLTNDGMNKVAWLGQAAVCIATGVPSNFRNGYNLLPKGLQDKSDALALKRINEWIFNKSQLEMF